MSAIVTLDGAGRIVIPKQLRDALHLAPGDTLSIEADDGHLALRPVRERSAMHKERGIWVFRSGKGISAEETDRAITEQRQARDRAACGPLG